MKSAILVSWHADFAEVSIIVKSQCKIASVTPECYVTKAHLHKGKLFPQCSDQNVSNELK